jgi:hypothetical protein
MPSEEQTSLVKLRGGLDTISDRVTLFETPGKTVSMVNFEGGLKGGYRRISGYTKYSTLSPDGVGTDPVVAARGYFNGCVAAQGGDIYFSEDGTSWLQVNKDTSGIFVDTATLAGLGSLIRTTDGAEHYRFVEYHNGTDTELFIVDTQGVNPLSRLVIKDVGGGTLNFKYGDAGATEWGTGNVRSPTTVEVHNERLVVSGDPAFKNEVHYSDLLEPFDFIGGGLINISDEVVWCETFRENLIVFGKGLVKGVAGLGDPVLQNIETITSKIGCAAGGSVQEVAGGLIFLAPDGLRTIAATDRIDDFELGTLTTDIQDEILDIIKKVDTVFITSTVVRSRNQYRLFVSDNLDPLKGIGGVIRGVGTEKKPGIVVEWNTFQGNSLYDVTSVRDEDNQEVLFQVNADSFVYVHDDGDTFNGTNIVAVFKTADMMLSDPNFRKTLHYVDTYINLEGVADLSFQIMYDEPFDNTASPGVYGTDIAAGLSLYDVAIYDTDTYDAGADIIERTPVQGSGKLVSFLFQSNGASASFTIQALNISYFLNGRF